MFHVQKVLWIVLLILAAGLVFPVSVLAAHYIINTNDTIVDPQWQDVNTTIVDPKDADDPGYDILQGWVTTDDTGRYMYFRVSTDARFPTNLYDSYIAARIDCSGDLDYDDPEDVSVLFFNDGLPGGDDTYECQGNDFSCTNGDFTNGETFAEEIETGATHDYEWMADTQNGNVDWSACSQNAQIFFETVDYAGEGRIKDITGKVWMDVPTALTLKGFDARANSRPILWVSLAVVMAIACAAYKVRRA